MLDDVLVIDAVSHAFDLTPSNQYHERHAQAITGLLQGMAEAHPPEYRPTTDSFTRDWDVEELASMLFLESQTDVSTFHPTPITAYKDGLTGYEKAKEAGKRWPNRFFTYATIDPLADGSHPITDHADPLEELERQVDELDPIGLKVYSSHWGTDTHESWRMDDPDVAFPLWERALDLGLETAAVHKAVPLGPVPMDPYRTDDIDDAAESFPELNFEIVHGGTAFSEETGWQLARYPNVYVNLEVTSDMAMTSPDSFVDALETLLKPGGKDAIERILWGTGAVLCHPRALLEAFWELDFPEMHGLLGDFEITQEDKRKILGENYVKMHGLDIDELQEGIRGDKFDQQQSENGLADPHSTTGATLA